MSEAPKTFGQRSGHKASTWGGIAALAAMWICQQFGVTNPQDVAAITAVVAYLGGMVRTFVEQHYNPSVAAPKGDSGA